MSQEATSAALAAPRKSEFRVDPGAPLFVAAAVLGSATLGGAVGAILGLSRHHSPIRYSVSTATNCGIAGLAFFGVREYVVAPYVSMKDSEAEQRPGNQLRSPIAQVRFTGLRESFVSGAIAGGGLSAAFRGVRTLPRAAFTAALVAGFVQLLVNESRAQRLLMLARREKDAEKLEKLYVRPPPNPALALPETVAEAFDDRVKAPDAKRGDSPLTQRILEKLTSVLPVRKIEDDEFLATMEKRTAEIQKRLGQIDEEQAALFARAQELEKP